MNEYVGWIGLGLQWARSQPKFSEWWYAGILVAGSVGAFWLSNPNVNDPRAFVQGSWHVLMTLAGGTQLTSTGANLASTVPGLAKLGAALQTKLGGTT